MVKSRATGTVTIKDIAARLGMSHSTVSRALNDRAVISEETRRLVKTVASQLGYVPNLSARMIRGDAAPIIGLMIPDVKNDFYSSTARYLAERCRKLGLRLLLAITDDNPETEYVEIRSLIEARVSGIIGTLTSEPLPETLALLPQNSFVQLVRRVPGLSQPSVIMADQAATFDAASLLLKLGHRNIGYVGTSEIFSTGQDRLQGFRNAMAEHGVEVKQGLVELVYPKQQYGFAGVSRLLHLHDAPSAILIGSSELVIGGLQAIRDAGLSIPRDISIIGYGDPVWFELLDPPLTSVSLPIERLAEAALNRLSAELHSGTTSADFMEHVVVPELIVRASCAPCGA